MDPRTALELPSSFWAPPPPPPGLPLMQEWGWPCPEARGYNCSSRSSSTATSSFSFSSSSSSSPASSPDSCSLSPAAPLRPGPQNTEEGALRMGPGAKKGPRGRLGSGQRQSASQREKLRMRRLAKALRALRHYLPPSVAPAGQALTKVETLRLASRYIAHLSELLGLSEEGLAAPWGAAPGAHPCHECPGPEPQPPPALEEEEEEERQHRAGPESWPWPPRCLQPPTFLEPSSTDGAGVPYARPGSPPGTLGSPATGAASRLSALMYGPEVGGSTATPGAEPLLLPAELADLGLSPQNLPGALVSFLEGFLPLASQEWPSASHALPASLASGLD